MENKTGILALMVIFTLASSMVNIVKASPDPSISLLETDSSEYNPLDNVIISAVVSNPDPTGYDLQIQFIVYNPSLDVIHSDTQNFYLDGASDTIRSTMFQLQSYAEPGTYMVDATLLVLGTPVDTETTTFDVKTMEEGIITHLSTDKGSYNQGETASVMCQVKNIGNVQTDYKLVFEVVGPSDTTVYTETKYVSNVDPGDVANTGIVFSITPSYTAGTYTLNTSLYTASDVFLDYSYVTFGVETAPSYQLSIDVETPIKTCNVGDNVPITVTLRNFNGDVTGILTVKAGMETVSSQTVSLPAGCSETYMFTWTAKGQGTVIIMAIFQAGDYTITDKTFVYVSYKPNVQILSVIVEPSVVGQNQYVELSIIVKNYNTATINALAHVTITKCGVQKVYEQDYCLTIPPCRHEFFLGRVNTNCWEPGEYKVKVELYLYECHNLLSTCTGSFLLEACEGKITVHTDREQYRQGQEVHITVVTEVSGFKPEVLVEILSPSGSKLTTLTYTGDEGTYTKDLTYKLPPNAELGIYTVRGVITQCNIESKTTFRVRVYDPLIVNVMIPERVKAGQQGKISVNLRNIGEEYLDSLTIELNLQFPDWLHGEESQRLTMRPYDEKDVEFLFKVPFETNVSKLSASITLYIDGRMISRYTADIMIERPAIILKIEKHISRIDGLTVEITLENAGDIAIENIIVEDQLPEGFKPSNIGEGTIKDNRIEWTVTLNPSETLTLRYGMVQEEPLSEGLLELPAATAYIPLTGETVESNTAILRLKPQVKIEETSRSSLMVIEGVIIIENTGNATGTIQHEVKVPVLSLTIGSPRPSLSIGAIKWSVNIEPGEKKVLTYKTYRLEIPIGVAILIAVSGKLAFRRRLHADTAQKKREVQSEKLRRLEELYVKGEISRETYLRLKEELEARG